MLRLVVDPNVFVSALLSPRGAPFRLIELWGKGACEIVVSPLVTEELTRVFGRDKLRRRLQAGELEGLLASLDRDGIPVADVAAPTRVTADPADPADDYLVALMEPSDAYALVSGDQHLTGLPATVCRVLTPRAAVALVEEIDEAQRPT